MRTTFSDFAMGVRRTGTRHFGAMLKSTFTRVSHSRHARFALIELATASLMALACAVTVQATPLTYDFTNSLVGTETAAFIATANQPLMFSSTPASAVTLGASAFRKNGAGNFVPAALHQNFRGLGIFSGAGDDVQVESVSSSEFLSFTFSQPVTLKSVLFTRVGLDDDFGLYVDGSITPTLEAPLLPGDAADLGTLLYVMPDIPGTTFVFTVSLVSWFNDDYKIAAMMVDDMITVPEPASWTMLTMAGGALIAGRVRRRRQAS